MRSAKRIGSASELPKSSKVAAAKSRAARHSLRGNVDDGRARSPSTTPRTSTPKMPKNMEVGNHEHSQMGIAAMPMSLDRARTENSGAGDLDFRMQIAQLQEAAINKDRVHAKDIAELEEMVEGQMRRNSVLEAKVQSLLRGSMNAVFDAANPGGAPPLRPPQLGNQAESNGAPPKQELEFLVNQMQHREEGYLAEIAELKATLNAQETRGAEAAARNESALEEVTSTQAKRNAELFGLIAEMKQREQHQMQAQEQLDTSHASEIASLEEMSTAQAKRNAELQVMLAEMKVSEEQARSKIAEMQVETARGDSLHANRIAELESKLETQVFRNTQLDAQLEDARAHSANRHPMDQQVSAELKQSLEEVHEAWQRDAARIQELEEQAAINDSLALNRLSRAELREQEHRMQLFELQLAMVRPNGTSPDEGYSSSDLAEVVSAMKRAERDYHFQQAAVAAAGAMCKSQANVHLAQLDASNAMLEAAIRTMREREARLAQLEDQLMQAGSPHTGRDFLRSASADQRQTEWMGDPYMGNASPIPEGDHFMGNASPIPEGATLPPTAGNHMRTFSRDIFNQKLSGGSGLPSHNGSEGGSPTYPPKVTQSMAPLSHGSSGQCSPAKVQGSHMNMKHSLGPHRLTASLGPIVMPNQHPLMH